ncbi:MAG: ABC transporter ATP-binding protein [Chloroflexi bacterium]|nr:ABC transporter ATP-binding protein [Chloroflexota bacterium]
MSARASQTGSDSDCAIVAADVWKRYGLPLRPYLRRQVDRLRGRDVSDRSAYGPWALREISFEVKSGESLGIVGKNGAGKSTLLKLIAGVSPATYGRLQVNGRLFPMIELAAGIHRDLTGRENIKLLGAIMGFTPRQMEAKISIIEDFAELGEWLDQPVWQYSSGMQARLGFSVAVNVDADILLIDEVLSVGDVNFQKKCLNRMDELTNSGVTIIFVTHNPYAIERLCDRAIYVHEGRIAATGTPDDILNAYFLKSMDRSTVIAGKDVLSADLREGTGAFRVTGITMHDVVSGDEITGFTMGESVDFRIALNVKEPVQAYNFSLRIVDPASTVVSFVTVPMAARPRLALQHDCVLQCRIENINLLPGQYWIDVVARELVGPVIDSVSYAYTFNIYGKPDAIEQMQSRGIVYLPTEWKLLDDAAPTPLDDE